MGLPDMTDSNQWGGGLKFDVLGQILTMAISLPGRSQGYQEISAGQATSLIDPSDFNPQLDAGLTLAQAMAIFRTYAAAKVNGFAGCPAVAQSSTLGGTTTPDINGTTPQAGNDA